ncbi:MAG: nicotinate-nucleotide adenylyltransferase [Gemmatimonadota bacterium]
MTRLGIFGGTFDPPHVGHLIVAADAFEALELDRLVFVPAADPPHKQGTVGATGRQRLRMLTAAVDGDARFAVDDLEIRRGGTSYTVDTLREIRGREPDAELVFLLGIDQFRALASWREPAEVARLAQLAVFSRGGETPDLTGPYEGVHVPVSRIDVSSTDVRRRLSQGLSVRYYVAETVRTIIEEERIYSSFEF